VHVVAGHEYVAFLTVFGDPFATGSAAMPTNSNTVPGIDYFVYNQTSDPFRNASWDYALFPGLNVADFSATFTARQVLVTPEPGTWAMMLLGFAGLSFAGYRRARSRGVPARAAV
jgi:PEP-CTERM motif